MILAEAINVTYGSLSFAAFGLAAVLASTDWRFRMALEGAYVRDPVVQERLDRLKALQQLTEIADQANVARGHAEPIMPESFGRNIKKQMVFNHR
ncbi:hypothetical protein ACR9YC_00725 [Parasphingorhabdus sp. DH2-15]|uniref:hypothetical protein n=1 Tax=Parasphingorhabdus sp. DH2-15 TaxID=3444112 RepID=UPI003F68882F